MPEPLIAVAPRPEAWVDEAVRSGGGVPTGEPGRATGLVWTAGNDPEALRRLLAANPAIEWVQLPAAGVERYAEAGVLRLGPRFTCAKGAYGEPVAEHALLLALAGLRRLHDRIPANSWGQPAGTSLFDEEVTILGGGGIASCLVALLAPLRARVTVVRRSGVPLAGVDRTLAPAALHEALAGALVVFVAVALTPATRGLVGAAELATMRDGAWLVNVARGGVVDTEALLEALEAGTIGGAALDVVDPEPLPDGHPLWKVPNCIVTPHTADTEAMIQPRLARRIAENVRRFASEAPLVGAVDPVAGY